MDLVFAPARRLAGEVSVPGDKSVTHRAYLLGAVAEGRTRVVRPNRGGDCTATLAALHALGVAIADEGECVTLEGRAAGFAAPPATLDLENSGTGLRLLAGLLAGRNVEATLTGDASLRRRPMGRIVTPLRAMGARIAAAAGDTAPLVVRGTRLDGDTLTGTTHESAQASAQVKSCLLLAGLAARGRTSVREPVLSRDHTERLLPHFGVPVARPAERTVAVEGPAFPRAAEVRVPGDFSSAFFWLVAGAVVEDGSLVVRDVGVNPTRTGGLAVLARMGARIRVERVREVGGEPVADIAVEAGPLAASDITADEVPALIDELPALAVAQACARGTSRVAGAAELRVKESDRIAAVVGGLRALGARIEERPDGWIVAGGPLAGGDLDSAGDHRLAMAFGVAGLVARGTVRVHGAEMIDTSYPGFYSALRDRVTSR